MSHRDWVLLDRHRLALWPQSGSRRLSAAMWCVSGGAMHGLSPRQATIRQAQARSERLENQLRENAVLDDVGDAHWAAGDDSSDRCRQLGPSDRHADYRAPLEDYTPLSFAELLERRLAIGSKPRLSDPRYTSNLGQMSIDVAREHDLTRANRTASRGMTTLRKQATTSR